MAFDDYQFACDSGPAERFVEDFASTSGLRLLVASRTRPRWATARRMVYGEIFEVGRSLLALDQVEAHSVLGDRRTDETDGLLSVADGWPALIGLATLAHNSDMPRETVPEEVYGFFAEELYRATSPELQQGLRRLSLAPYVTPDVAEKVIGEDAEDFIDRGLELGFLVSSRERLELHPLLRTFLAAKFRRHQDDPTGSLVAGLADVLLAREEWDDVFELASRFADDGLLIELFEASLRQMLEQARLPTLARWIAASKSRALDSPVIDLADAEMAFRRGELDRAEALARQAARRFSRDHRLVSRALWVAGTSAHLASRDEAALELFTTAKAAANTEEDASQALWGEFLATEALERERDARALLARIIDNSGDTVDEVLRIASGQFRLALLCCDLEAAAASHESLIHLADRSRDPLIRSSFLYGYASLLVLTGRYADAVEAADSEIEFITNSSLDFVMPVVQLLVASSRLGLRQFTASKTSLAICERTANDSRFVACNIGFVHAKRCLATQQRDGALAVLDRIRQLAKSCPPAHGEYLAWCSLAHAVAGNDHDAAALASQAESLSCRIDVTALVPWTRAVLAARSDHAAHSAAEAAFAITVESGNVDAFVSAYRAHPPLLELVAADSAYHERLATILERARDHDLARQVGLDLPSPREVEGPASLSKREREVFELISQALTNKEIGRALFIAEGTVKVHVRRICQKLGVRSRTEAVARAAEFSASG